MCGGSAGRGPGVCAQSRPALHRLIDCSPPVSSAQGISQARILKWVAISGELPDPGIEPASPALSGGFFSTEPPGKPRKGGRW